MTDSEEIVLPPNPEVIAQLRVNTREWIELDDKERDAKQVLKVVADRKKELGGCIVDGLKDARLDEVRLMSGGRLKYCETSTYAPLKRETVFSNLLEELNDEQKAKTLTEKLWSKDCRECKKVISLKRTKK